MIPSVIPAIKMVVDVENLKGMFLLTGSSDMFKNSKLTTPPPKETVKEYHLSSLNLLNNNILDS